MKISLLWVFFLQMIAPGSVQCYDDEKKNRGMTMEDIYLTAPAKAFEKEIQSYKEEFLQTSKEIEGSSYLTSFATAAEWLENLRLHESWETVPPERIPGLEFLLVREKDQRILGMSNLRLGLNEYLTNFGGHIGYSIRPNERRKHYGIRLLQLTLDKAKDAGLEKVLITCKDTNTASARIIEHNGGVLEDKREDEKGRLMRRYWVEV